MTGSWNLSILIATGVAIVTGSAILANALYEGNTGGKENVLGFLLHQAPSSTSAVGSAEATILPLDVKETFRSAESTGDAEGTPSRLAIDSEFVDPDEHCEFCYRIELIPGESGKAGLALSSEKVVNLADARRLAFYARGESGVENVQFSAGGKYVDGAAGKSKQLKFAFTSEDTKLGTKWQKYQIDLSKADLSEITHGFGVSVTRSDLKDSGQSIVIYLKGITFDTLIAEKALRSSATDAPPG